MMLLMSFIPVLALGQEHFDPVYEGNPIQSMRIYTVEATLNGEPVQAGDEIGIFDGEMCVGAARVEAPITDPEEDFVLVIAKIDDPSTPETEGATADNPISYRIWDASEFTEYRGISAEYSSGDGIFNPGGNAIVSLSTEGSTGKSLRLTQPNGGEQWSLGDTRTIEWQSQNLTGNIEISLLRDEEPVMQIAGEVSVTSGSYEWEIPEALGEGFNYRVQIVSLSDGGLSDQSNQPFTISQPASASLRILNPQPSTTWYRGQSYAIKWQSEDVGGNVNIELLHNGEPAETLISETENDGKYIWEIPEDQQSGEYQIQISSLSQDDATATSGVFQIQNWTQEIGVTVPNSATIWSLGEENVLIGWQTGNLGGSVGIDLLRDSVYVLTITGSTNNDGGYTDWTVPDTLPVADNYMIRISQGDSVSALSSAFEIQPQIGNLEVLQPSDTTIWMQSERNVPIRWNTGNLQGPVDISLYRGQEGQRNRIATIANSVPNTGEYAEWDVPSLLTPGTNYQVRVLYDDEHFDYSDRFRVQVWSGPILVTVPSDTTRWTQGEKDVVIRWETGGLDGSVELVLTGGNGIEREIVGSTPNDGRYAEWDIPYDVPAGGNYEIGVIFNENNYAYSEPFEILTAFLSPMEHTLTQVSGGALSLGDYDNDGDQDLFLSGRRRNGDPYSALYETTEFPEFRETGILPLEQVIVHDAEWVDYNQDGLQDLSVAGRDEGTQPAQPVVKLYTNLGDGQFEEHAKTLSAQLQSTLAWADFNNDTLPDLLVTGNDSSVVYKNTGNGGLVLLNNQSLDGIQADLAEWGDFDNDGDQDIVLAGLSGTPRCIFYEYTGDDTFQKRTPDALETGMYFGGVAAGDYDSDGDIDIIATGETTGGPKTHLYRNNGEWSFTVEELNQSPVSSGELAFLDIDRDSDEDLLISGRVSGIPSTILYENTGNENFKVLTENLTDVTNGKFAWGDIDGDGDTDLAFSGNTLTGAPAVSVYRNNAPSSPSEPPVPPSRPTPPPHPVPPALGTEDPGELPDTFVLTQNYPNPFNPGTNIWYFLPEHVDVKLTVFNLRGEEVETLVDKHEQQGWHKIRWVPGARKAVSSGMYIYRLRAGKHVRMKKMLYIR